MIGRTISHYQIVEKLGSGGMGEVYRARDTRLNRFVAVKALPSDQAGDPERRSRFLREVQAASALNHPNIITVHDVAEDEGGQYLVMELVSGSTLSEIIDGKPLPVVDVLSYAIQIADALAAAHAAGILHRDLKPGNVMVTGAPGPGGAGPGLLKLLDFGLAKRITGTPLSDLDANGPAGPAPVTTQGTILGTASYMSPEQVRGKGLDGRSDIFSFGLLLYEMTTGHRAFDCDSVITTMTAVLRDDPPPIGDQVRNLPVDLERLIYRCLRKDPELRWQSMAEVRANLGELKLDLQSGRIPAALPPATPGPGGTRAPGGRRRQWLLGVAGAVAVLALMAGGGWLWTAWRRPAPPPLAKREPAAGAPVAESSPALGSQQSAPETAEQPKARRASSPRKSARRDTLDTAPPQPVATVHNLPPDSAPAPLRTQAPAASPKAPAVAPPPLSAPAPAPGPADEKATLPDGARVTLALVGEVSAEGRKGDVVKLVVADDVKVGNVVVIPKGAPVGAVIGQAGRRFPFVRKGNKIPLLLDGVSAVDGAKVQLRGTVEPQRSKRPIEISPSDEQAIEAYVDGGLEITLPRNPGARP